MVVIDFSVARSQHAAWKTKLAQFLEGRATLTEAQATSPRDCELGKWLYSTGQQKFGDVLGMKDLEKVHAEMHALIKHIVQLQHGGKQSEAKAEFQKVEPLSTKVIALLKSIETQVHVAQ